MGEVIQLQGDQRKDVQEFLVDKKDGLELDAKTIKVLHATPTSSLTQALLILISGPRILKPERHFRCIPSRDAGGSCPGQSTSHVFYQPKDRRPSINGCQGVG